MPTAIGGVDPTPDTNYGAYACRGVGGKNGMRFAIKFSGQINEVSKKIRPTLFLKPLSAQEITRFSRVLAKYLFTREIDDRAIHLFPFGREVAVSSSGHQDRHST
jgi:hypothetical protein